MRDTRGTFDRQAGNSGQRALRNVLSTEGKSRDIAVSIATDYGLDDTGVGVSPGKVKNVLFSMSVRLALGIQLASYPNGYQGLTPGVKRPRREAGHSPPASVEVKKTWIYLYIQSPISLHGVVLN
jgi:hypothetical protein